MNMLKEITNHTSFKQSNAATLKSINAQIKATNTDIDKLESEAIENIRLLINIRDAYHRAADAADTKIQSVLKTISNPNSIITD